MPVLECQPKWVCCCMKEYTFAEVGRIPFVQSAFNGKLATDQLRRYTNDGDGRFTVQNESMNTKPATKRVNENTLCC